MIISEAGIGLTPEERQNMLFDTGPNCAEHYERELFEALVPGAQTVAHTFDLDTAPLTVFQDIAKIDLATAGIALADIACADILPMDSNTSERFWLPHAHGPHLLKVLARKVEMEVDDTEVAAAREGVNVLSFAMPRRHLQDILTDWRQNNDGQLADIIEQVLDQQ